MIKYFHKYNIPQNKKLRNFFGYLFRSMLVVYYTLIRLFSTFEFNGKRYNYFNANYNRASTNERTVEIPIVMQYVNENKNKKILEIGNVLPYYFSFPHDVLDKYEVSNNVINEEIVSFNTNKKYDLIVSVSTFEHIGYDENPVEPEKVILAIKKTKDLLQNGGLAVITVPIGHNPVVDRLLKNKEYFDELYFLKRISKNNTWIQSNWEDVSAVKYNEPFKYANAIAVGVIKK